MRRFFESAAPAVPMEDVVADHVFLGDALAVPQPGAGPVGQLDAVIAACAHQMRNVVLGMSDVEVIAAWGQRGAGRRQPPAPGQPPAQGQPQEPPAQERQPPAQGGDTAWTRFRAGAAATGAGRRHGMDTHPATVVHDSASESMESDESLGRNWRGDDAATEVAATLWVRGRGARPCAGSQPCAPTWAAGFQPYTAQPAAQPRAAAAQPPAAEGIPRPRMAAQESTAQASTDAWRQAAGGDRRPTTPPRRPPAPPPEATGATPPAATPPAAAAAQPPAATGATGKAALRPKTPPTHSGLPPTTPGVGYPPAGRALPTAQPKPTVRCPSLEDVSRMRAVRGQERRERARSRSQDPLPEPRPQPPAPAAAAPWANYRGPTLFGGEGSTAAFLGQRRFEERPLLGPPQAPPPPPPTRPPPGAPQADLARRVARAVPLREAALATPEGVNLLVATDGSVVNARGLGHRRPGLTTGFAQDAPG